MGTVSRVHTFSSGAILTAAQLNNEFDNLLTSSAINGGLDATNLGVTAGQATASKALVVDSSRNLADGTAGNRINNLALSGTLESTGLITATAGITSGSNIVSDTDSTDDLGTTGVRWRNLYVDDVTVTNNVSIGGTLTLTGGLTLNGNVAIGDSASDTLTVNSTITSNLIFTDNTYDIGASGATRPRDLHLSRNALMGGTLGVTGLLTATAGVTSGSNIVSDTDGTDDLGLTGTRWRYVYADDIAITNDLAVTEGGTGASTASAARTNLGVAIGSDVQAYDAGLADIAGLATSDGNIIVGSGSNWVAESGATARTSLGLGSIATQAADNVSISGGSLTGMTSYSGGSFSGTTGLYTSTLATSAGDIGVGTHSPSGLGARTLNIKAGSSAGADLTIEADNGNNFGVFFSGATASDPFSIFSNTGFKFAIASDKNATGFDEALRIKSDGTVGIGTSSPTKALSVVGDAVFDGPTQTISSAGAGRVGAAINLDSNYSFENGYTANGAISGSDYLGAVYFNTADASGNGAGVGAAIRSMVLDPYGRYSLDFHTTGNSVSEGDDALRMRINHAGLVGIGTNAPTTLLELNSATGPEITITRNDLVIAQDDVVGGIRFASNDTSTALGTPPHYGAGIKAVAEGTVGFQALKLYAGQDNLGYENDTPNMALWPSGDVFFYNTTGARGMAWDASASSLGIGTQSPVNFSNQTSLTVNGNLVGRVDVKASESGGGAMYGTSSGLTMQANSGVAVNIVSASGQPITFMVDSSEKARILSSGGITFNGDTASANALDDYEEGTHVVTIGCSTSGTLGLNSGRNTVQYTKVGDLVLIQGFLEVNSASSGVGYVTLSMPYANHNQTQFSGITVGKVILNMSSGPLNCDQYVLYMSNGASELRIYATDGKALSPDVAEDITTNGGADIFLNFSYRTT